MPVRKKMYVPMGWIIGRVVKTDFNSMIAITVMKRHGSDGRCL